MTNSSTNNIPTLQCPTCLTTVLWNDHFPERPFCSKRCKMVDFGDWANENHRIEGATPDFLEGEAPNDAEDSNANYN